MSSQIRSKTAYSRARTLEDFAVAVASPETFYNSHVVNRKGRTSDTGELYTEIISGVLSDNLELLTADDKFTGITREKSYKVNHPYVPVNLESRRKEEQTARSFMGKTFEGLGEIIDYQTPLYNGFKKGLEKAKKQGAGKIDLLSYNTQDVFMIEYKWKNSTETLLRCVLEIYSYWRKVNREKLLQDFGYPHAGLKKAVLVYPSCQAFIEYQEPNTAIRKLMEKLEVEFFALNENELAVFPENPVKSLK